MSARRAKRGGADSAVPAGRRRVMLAGFVLLSTLVLARAFQVEVLEGGEWRERALAQHGDTLPLPAPRGAIYDRNGIPLAATQEVYRVAVAPREIRDAERVASLLREHCELSLRQAQRVTGSKRRWVVLAGHYPPAVREALDGVRGVHFETVLRRFYPQGTLALEMLGAVGMDGEPQGGLELEFDSILRGEPGRSAVRRDALGRVLPGAMLRTREPTPGRDLRLTLDLGLQEIAESALGQAVAEMDAAGGELLLADPLTGEILAAASRSADGRSRSWRAVTEPYEPGSTLKPFTVAGLLSLRRATLEDSVFAENGEYRLPGRRSPLRDVHGYGMLSLGDALRHSSNIALAKVAMRLRPEEQYTMLRDLGFGTPTGIAYPSESGGRLRRPAQWSGLSQTSLAIGYELSVTPLQMALAYATIANGGLLLEPRLVREVRARDGRIERTFQPRAVRRVMPERVATQLRDVLEDAVTDGTAQRAALGPFSVAGKTGTTRIASAGGYRAGAYFASFAGFFPADEPQLVFLVKIDEPRGSGYYGGLVAAPVIRVALEAALAAHNTPLDRRAVATPAPELPRGGAVRLAPPLPRGEAPATVITPVRQRMELRTAASAAAPDTLPVRVPETAGLSLRDAARTLHAAGFVVRVQGRGVVRETVPAAGRDVVSGTTVRVLAEVHR